jgi:hypothetical protein
MCTAACGFGKILPIATSGKKSFLALVGDGDLGTPILGVHFSELTKFFSAKSFLCRV